jgi:hypothetical protein
VNRPFAQPDLPSALRSAGCDVLTGVTLKICTQFISGSYNDQAVAEEAEWHLSNSVA